MSRDLEDCHDVLGPMRASQLLLSAAALDMTNVSMALFNSDFTGRVPKSNLSNQFSLPMRKAQVSLPRLNCPPGEPKVLPILLKEPCS